MINSEGLHTVQFLFGKWKYDRLVKKFTLFMETDVLLPCSQHPATGSYVELHEEVHKCTLYFP